jgi:hypothetical protein
MAASSRAIGASSRELQVVLHRRPLDGPPSRGRRPCRAGAFQAFAHHARLDGIEHIGDAQKHGVRWMRRQKNL